MVRRSAGEGTVFQNSNGRWSAMLELPRKSDGKRQRKLRRGRTRADAQRLLREMRDEFNASGSVSSATRKMTEALEEYRSVRYAQVLSGGTLGQNQWLYDLIEEGLGLVRIASLTVEECDHFLECCAFGLDNRRPISRVHIKRLRSTLVNILHNEMRIGNLTKNVAELAVLPSDVTVKKERRALSRDELQTVLEMANGSRLIIFDLAGRNGLRPGEARALRWSDLDLLRGELSVTGQQDKQNRRTGPKTKRAARTIQLDETTLDRLEVWKVEQAEMKNIARSAWTEMDIVASTATGKPVDRHNLARTIRGICKRGDIDPAVTPYELRHTAISFQADAGHSSWEIADWAGTSEAMISERYRHRLRRVSSLRPTSR